MGKETILVVDDEREIAELVRDYLEYEGFNVILAFDGQQALKLYQKHQPDMAILDVMLPKLDGLEVCKTIRSKSSIPILMLSAKKSDVDKILGLGLGADDYVTKPFSPKVLVARVMAHLRRYRQISDLTKKGDRLSFSNLVIDLGAYSVYVNDKPVALSSKEFEVLKFLAMHPNRVFTREEIFNNVWGYNEYGDINTVTVHISKIREKIEKDPACPVYIQTVWGVGYKFTGGNT
ncbi:MAG: response regulator transcription factor [Clostridiales bacterium]|jgi:DNA-binding response OmpR family regulator|nr:response regulator transcription factor [Clostridiales bacterium]